MSLFKKLSLFIFPSLLLLTMFIINTDLMAQNPETQEDNEKIKWERHDSITGIFKTKFPKSYKYKIYPFRYNNNTTVFSTQILAALDGGEPSSKNNIMIRAVQTFGGQLTLYRTSRILDRAAERYAASAKAMNGHVVTNENYTYQDFLGKHIYITYTEDGEKYGIRIRILMTDYAKIEQVLTGTVGTLYAYKAEHFFNSIKIFDGVNKSTKPGKFAVGWIKTPSKNNIFTIMLPPLNSNYTPHPAEMKATPNKERLRFRFVDPVTDEGVIYNVYSYKMGQLANYEIAKQILFSSHVRKYIKKADISSLKTTNAINGSTKIMSTVLNINPPKKLPFVNTLILNLQYKDDTVVVQEILTNKRYREEGLPKLLADNLKFHPEKYKYIPPTPEEKKANRRELRELPF